MAAGSSSSSISVIISAATSGFTSAIHSVQTSLHHLQSTCSSATSSISHAFGGIGSAASSALGGIASMVNPITTALNPLAGKIKTIADTLMSVGSAVADFGLKAVQASANMETMRAGLEFNFEKQLGDPAAAKEKVDLLVNSMQKIGEMSAYDSGQLLPMARSWVNIGDSAETAIAKMRTIVDAGSAYGLTGEAMERVNLALTQMQMKGKMQAEEMMQLTEAGIPAWTLLSQAMGLPVQQLQDMASKGQLTQEAMAALFTGMQEQTGGMAENLGGTLSGMFANIREAAENSMSTVGDLIVQGLNVKGILGEVGEFTGDFVEHLNLIKTHAEEVGVGQAITDELTSVGLYGVAEFVGSVIDNFEEIWHLIEAMLLPAIDRLGGGFDSAGGTCAESFNAMATVVEFFIVVLTGIIDILNIILHVLGAFHDFAKWVFDSIADAVGQFCSWMTQTFGETFAWIENAWNQLREWLSHPIDLIINIIWHDTKDGTSTAGNKITGGGNSPAPHNFSVKDFGGGGSGGASFGGSSGGGGSVGRSGGGSGRSGGGSGRGSQKEAPWEGRKDYIAEVAKQADEAAKIIVDKSNAAAEKVKNTFGSIMNSFKSNELGDKLKAAYANASKEADKAQSILQKISNIGKNTKVDAYGKILEQAAKEAGEVGEQVQKFRKYLQTANEEAAKYNDDGEKTLQFKQKEASLLNQIADLQDKINRGKAKEDDTGKLDQLRQQLARDTAKYEMAKSKAQSEAERANAAAPEVEQAAQERIAAIESNANNELGSRKTALKAAQDQQSEANYATSLEEYMAMMDAKDERTNQSYAQMLAQEEALNAQRQVWHEQLMMNAMEWSDYMSMTFASLNQQLIDGLSSGLAECIVQGKSLADIFKNLAANLLQTLINNVLKKWLTSLIGIGAQTKINAAQETANAAKTVAIERTKTPVLTENAIAASIAARPIVPAAITAGEVIGAVGMGKIAGFATGGLVSGAGTSTSDSIPAMLSNGEFVMRAEAVNRLGTSTLYALNEGKTFHYSDGGQVGTGSAGTAAVSSPSVTLNVSAMDASGFESFLLQGGLDTIRQALFDNNRNFGAAAGVF